MITFPNPPAELLECQEQAFAPAMELGDWARETFIEDEGALSNPDHEHLQLAMVLFVWSALPVKKQGRFVVGTAQTGEQSGAPAKKQLAEWVYRSWNGGLLPDFVVTICATYVHEADPVAICALVEHELYHCAQAVDGWGNPKFHKDSTPVFAMRGHDVEEFVGVVKRYGAHSPVLEEFRAAMNKAVPNKSNISNAVCGCGARL